MIELFLAGLALGALHELPGSTSPFSGNAEERLSESLARFPSDRQLALRDMDGDGDLELVVASASEILVHRMKAGSLEVAQPVRHEFPEGRLAWDLADIDGDGASDLILVSEAAVHLRRLGPEGFEPEELVIQARCLLPAGVRRARVARDVDGDGRCDLVLPGSGAHSIHLAADEGWANPLLVEYELEAEYQVGDPSSLSSTIGQVISVPWFELRDVDGDGDRDLIGRTSDRVSFHLAEPVLDSTPTWILDLEQLRAELPRRDGFDTDDLFSNIEGRVDWRIADLDEEGAWDLVVILGSKLRIYPGGSRTGPDRDPAQVLKASGAVLWTFLRQVGGDELPDLQLVRAERISIGRVVRSLILPSALDFDLFTYRNEGGTFSRRPTRSNRVSIEVPRLLSVIENIDDLEEAFKEKWEIRARRLQRSAGAPAAGDDVVDLRGQQVLFFDGCAPAPNVLEDLVEGSFDAERIVEGYFLEDLDRRGDGASRTLDLGDLQSFDFSPGALLREACGDLDPGLAHPLAMKPDQVSEVLASDLDGDGRQDVLVVGKDWKTKDWLLQVLVRL